MGNKKEHIVVGFLVSVLQYVEDKKSKYELVDINEMFRHGLVGAIGGVLPDVIEPPTSPYHRGIFHSLTAVYSIGNIIEGINNNTSFTDKQKSILKALLLGYGSHLVYDSTTPASLPLI